jgi:hypothetical protein
MMLELPSWRAAETIGLCGENYRDNKHIIKILHTGREALQTPHMIANWTRKQGQTGSGTYPLNIVAHLKLDAV